MAYPGVLNCLLAIRAYQGNLSQTMGQELISQHSRIGLDLDHVDCYTKVDDELIAKASRVEFACTNRPSERQR